MRKLTKQKYQKTAACLLSAAMITASVFTADTAKPVSAQEDATAAASETEASASEAELVITSPNRVSVHDPSIAKSKDGMYYVFGSHLDAARSSDLVNWTSFTNGYASTGNIIFDDLETNLAKPFAWAGCRDVDARPYSVWAPDVFWNEDYQNTDGSTGAYMIYFCTTSTAYRSAISFAVSQDIEGPYTYADTIVYSGFTKVSAFDNGSSIDTCYTNTNIAKLIADGKLDGLNDSWFRDGGKGYDPAYGPNAIDSELFYDADGKLWMTYGSWSGGIFILEIDPATGQPLYPGKTYTNEDGLLVDSYFGTKIGGGFRRSGEGPFIVYDRESGYYYFYMSYEGLQADKGYHMRLFRSKSPDGPYLDAKGNHAVLPEWMDHSDIGIKVMGNYTFSCLETAYKAEGHNSAFIDEDGQRYIIYHTRFANRGELHQVRVHQQFLNEEGWPVTAVFENKNDPISETGYALSAITGEYEFINHGLQSDLANVNEPKSISLQADGSISGDVTGTWSKKDGTYYMNAVINDVHYSGVFFAQHDESKEGKKAMTFTAVGDDDTTIWGVRKDAYVYSDDELTARTLGDLELSLAIPSTVVSDLALPSEGFEGTSITWSSSNPKIVSNEGKVTRPEQAEKVTLTALIANGSSEKTKTYEFTVAPSVIEPDYRFDFETTSGTEAANSASKNKDKTAKLHGSASVSMEAGIGNVLTITNTPGVQSANYLALPSDLFQDADDSGYALSMWVKLGGENYEESALFEAKSSTSRTGAPFSSLCVSSRAQMNDTSSFYTASTNVPLDTEQWMLLTYNVTKNGLSVYVNGQKRAEKPDNLTTALSPGILSQMDDIRIGSGTISHTSDLTNASFDEIEFYSIALSEKEISQKYETEKNSHPDFRLLVSRKTLYTGGNTKKTGTASVSCSVDRDYSVSYNSNQNSVLSIDKNGTMTAKKAGKAIITASVKIDGTVKTLKKTVTVKKASLKIASKKSSMKIGSSAVFKVKGYGFKVSGAKWSSSKPDVLSVNAKTGKVTAKKTGKAKITVKFKKVSANVEVKVTK